MKRPRSKYHCVCRDEATGMEFDFELDSTNRRAATEEAHAKYRNVVRIYKKTL